MNRLSLTYALLGHYKEKCNNANRSIWEIYLPMVKKAFYDYFVEKNITEIKGQAITELQQKIEEIFEIRFPIPVLRECMTILQEEIDDSSQFIIYQDNAFDVKFTAIQSVEELIKESEKRLSILENDFNSFCQVRSISCDFNMLLKFINTMHIEMMTNEMVNLQELNNAIPTYINTRKKNKEIFNLISNVYTGSLLSSYLSHKIQTPVAKVELLIDTNFFISLIDLNTEDAYITCQDLYKYCKDMGFYMTILPTTVEQIKILLTNRITDFSYKDYFGTIKTADIFAACKRKGIDRTQLETIRDKVEETLTKYDITILKEAQITQIVDRAKKSEAYKILKERRIHKDSALNDAIAIEYVSAKRGNNCTSFSDVKCWFLHNSYGNFYRDPGVTIAKRTSIGAPELLTMLWMANPAQVNSTELSRIGLTSYVTKYMEQHLPSDNTLITIQKRAKRAQESGNITEIDFYNLCARMSEGCLTQEEATNIENMPDEEFSIYMAQQTAARNTIIKQAEQAILADKERTSKIQRFKELQKNKNNIISELSQKNAVFIQFEEQRNKSFKNWEPILCWVVFGIMIIIGFILILLKESLAIAEALLYIIPILAAAPMAVAIHLMANIESRKQKWYEKWENKPQNTEFRKLKKDIEEKNKQLQGIEEQLSQFMNEM